MKKVLLYSILIWLCATACSDYLDLKPSNIVTDEDVYANESGVKTALTRLYIDLPIEDYRFDQRGGFNNTNYKFEELETITGFARNRKQDDGANLSGNSGNSWWNYTVIRNVCKYIENLNKYSAGMTADKVDGYQAEGYAIRAWYYFAMAKRFGGLPYIDKVLEYSGPSSIPSLEIPRNSEQETWDYILADLDKALELNIPENNPQGRINKAVVYALKAQVAIYAASIAKYNDLVLEDENTGKMVCGIPASEADRYYEIAYQAANEIIKSEKYELARSFDTNDLSENFRKIFLNVEPDKNKEVIMSRSYSYPDLVYRFDVDRLPWGGQSNPNSCPTLDLVEQFEYLDGTPGTFNTPAGSYIPGEFDNREDLFADRDARLLGSVIVPGSTFQGELIDVKYGEINASGKEQTSAKYRGKYGMGEDNKTPTSMFQKKMIDDSKKHSLTEFDSDQPWTVIRYAEILLIAAEAQVELGHPEIAQPLINDIRTRAGLQELPVSAITIGEVRRQYICEFVFENKIFWNYRRWRIFDQVMGELFRPRGLFPMLDTRTNKWKYKVDFVGTNDLLFLKKYYYNSISADEIKKNPKLVQNYGY